MDECKRIAELKDLNTQSKEFIVKEGSPNLVRREFMKRYGSYTAGAAVGLFVLMSTKKSHAASDSAP